MLFSRVEACLRTPPIPLNVLMCSTECLGAFQQSRGMPSYSSNSFERVLADWAPKSSIGVFWVFNGHVAEIHEWSVCNDCCSPPFLSPLLCVCSRAAILDLTIVNGVDLFSCSHSLDSVLWVAAHAFVEPSSLSS